MMRSVVWVYGSAVGLVAAYLLFILAHHHWGMNVFASVMIALIGGIPFLGNAAAVYAATEVWEWGIEIGILVFFVSVFVVSKGASEIAKRRAA